MTGADYICCEICGCKIVYSPEHQPEMVCDTCYLKVKAKDDLFDKMVKEVRVNFSQGCSIVKLMTIVDDFAIKAKELTK